MIIEILVIIFYHIFIYYFIEYLIRRREQRIAEAEEGNNELQQKKGTAKKGTANCRIAEAEEGNSELQKYSRRNHYNSKLFR